MHLLLTVLPDSMSFVLVVISHFFILVVLIVFIIVCVKSPCILFSDSFFLVGCKIVDNIELPAQLLGALALEMMGQHQGRALHQGLAGQVGSSLGHCLKLRDRVLPQTRLSPRTKLCLRHVFLPKLLLMVSEKVNYLKQITPSDVRQRNELITSQFVRDVAQGGAPLHHVLAHPESLVVSAENFHDFFYWLILERRGKMDPTMLAVPALGLMLCSISAVMLQSGKMCEMFPDNEFACSYGSEPEPAPAISVPTTPSTPAPTTAPSPTVVGGAGPPDDAGGGGDNKGSSSSKGKSAVLGWVAWENNVPCNSQVAYENYKLQAFKTVSVPKSNSGGWKVGDILYISELTKLSIGNRKHNGYVQVAELCEGSDCFDAKDSTVPIVRMFIGNWTNVYKCNESKANPSNPAPQITIGSTFKLPVKVTVEKKGSTKDIYSGKYATDNGVGTCGDCSASAKKLLGNCWFNESPANAKSWCPKKK